MSNIIQGIKVRSTTYKYDYNSLENLPAPELPSSTQSDSGKTLTVNSSGDPAWKTPAEGALPVIGTNDEGKVLIVNDNSAEWGEAIPAHDTSYNGSDTGKALVVATNGEIKWDRLAEVPGHNLAHMGDVLTIGGCNDSEVIWRSPFPDYNPTYDVGKVLTITENGPEWVMPS